jgi:hypothetical protein
VFERLNRRLFRLRTNVAVAFEHLAADVARQRAYRLLADARIFGQPRNESVPQIMPAVTYLRCPARTAVASLPATSIPTLTFPSSIDFDGNHLKFVSNVPRYG